MRHYNGLLIPYGSTLLHIRVKAQSLRDTLNVYDYVVQAVEMHMNYELRRVDQRKNTSNEGANGSGSKNRLTKKTYLNMIGNIR